LDLLAELLLADAVAAAGRQVVRKGFAQGVDRIQETVEAGLVMQRSPHRQGTVDPRGTVALPQVPEASDERGSAQPLCHEIDQDPTVSLFVTKESHGRPHTLTGRNRSALATTEIEPAAIGLGRMPSHR
jgi:hypothetical protein